MPKKILTKKKKSEHIVMINSLHLRTWTINDEKLEELFKWLQDPKNKCTGDILLPRYVDDYKECGRHYEKFE